MRGDEYAHLLIAAALMLAMLMGFMFLNGPVDTMLGAASDVAGSRQVQDDWHAERAVTIRKGE